MTPLQRVFGLLSVTLFFALPTRIFAQWQTSARFSYTITSVRFLQEEGAWLTPPQQLLLHGLVGGQQHISYRISAPIAPWQSANVPSSWNDGYISDFTFEDTLTGYAAIHGAASSFYSNSGVSGVLKTSDGGATWNFLSSAPPEVRGIYFDKANGRLFASSGDVDDIGGNGVWSGVWVSTNHGSTWTRINVTSTLPHDASPYNQRCYYTGFASWDGLHIVLATKSKSNFYPCSHSYMNDYPNWLFSSDGGLTWQTSDITNPSWQPVALKNTSSFYASSLDATQTPPKSSIFMSQDAGISWQPVSSFGESGSVTEVMGGDPCLIVAPDSGGSGNYYSKDDAAGWTDIGGASEPAPPFDLRNYVGRDSIWLFQSTHLYSTARPLSNPIHISPTTVDFPNSGCFANDTVINVYGCNCTLPTSQNILLTGGSLTDSIHFAVTGLKTSSLCGPDTFHVKYIPNTPNTDSTRITINYTVNGSPKTYTMHATGAGVQTSITTNWGNKVTLKTIPCEQIDTSLTIFNPTCNDIQIVIFDSIGGNGSIWYNRADVPLPVTIPGRGGSFKIPFHAASLQNGTSSLLVKFTSKAGNTFLGKQFSISLIVNGPLVKPFVRGIDDTLAFACNGKALDTAVYYFDTTCWPSVITNIHLKNQTDLNFTLDLSKWNFPDTVWPLNDVGVGKEYYLRVPLHLNATKPGTYTDSVIFEDQLVDGTVLRTSALVRYVIKGSLNLTPTALLPVTQSFGIVRDCDSAYLTFKDSITNSCSVPVVVSNIQSILWGGQNKNQYQIVAGPKVGDTLAAGAVMTLRIAWPFGAQNTPPQGWVKITYKNGNDSATVQHAFSGIAVPCNLADVEQPAPNNFSIHSDGKQLHIALGDATPATFELQNLLGETILTSSISGSASIDDRSVTPGVYFYRVTIRSRIVTGKITLP